MRIASGVVDQYTYFVAVSATTGERLTGLSSFTVYRSRNGGAAVAMTTPTVVEVSGMVGVYALLMDEDMTIDVGDYTQAMVFDITATGMAQATKEIELFRPADDVVLNAATGDFTTPDTIGGEINDLMLDVIEIKAKTDSLTFTVAGQVDANVESINGAEVLGNGTSGDLWRG